MSTYSTSLKLTLIGDGEQTGTWGQTTNTNLGTLLEEAIVGQTTIIMANADYTLTNLDGVSDEARNAVIIVTGNQNATYSVIVPAVEKLYMVTNSLNSSAIAYIKPSGGSAIQVPNGRTMYLYCTGTAFVALDYVQYAQSIVSGGTITTGAINCTSLTSSGAIVGTTINGTTIAASTQFSGPGTGLTGTASSLTAGNVSGIVAVLNGGTGVTTSTGTGSVVLSTSPTLVTPLLGTPTSGNLANCTGYPSGSISGNINLATQVTGTLAVLNGGTGVTSSTGTGSVVLSTSPTLITPALGTPSSGNLANCTFPTLNQNTTGNAATATTAVTVSTTVASGATGTTQTAGDNSTKIATTAYVATAVTNATGALGTMSTQNANNVAITGGTINGVSGTNASLTVGNATTAVTVSTTVASGAVGTTQAFGTNNTTIATTAFVQAALALLYPVGSIYSSTVSTNPNTLFGFGTWTAYAAGRVTVGNGGGFTAGATGGSADATLVSHNHTATSVVTDPGHAHTGTTGGQSADHTHISGVPQDTSVYGVASTGTAAGKGGTINYSTSPITSGTSNDHSHSFTTAGSGTGVTVATSISTEGASATNANLQPYVVVYMWNRTA